MFCWLSLANSRIPTIAVKTLAHIVTVATRRGIVLFVFTDFGTGMITAPIFLGEDIRLFCGNFSLPNIVISYVSAYASKT